MAMEGFLLKTLRDDLLFSSGAAAFVADFPNPNLEAVPLVLGFLVSGA
jgi:hypothetical protein